MGWSAIVVAGQRPGADPLASHFGLEAKALVPIAGRPMLAYVLETLLAVEAIERIVVLAQDAPALLAASGVRDARIGTAVSGAGISTSVAAVAGQAVPWPVLLTTADHPLLTPEMVRHFLAHAAGGDVAVGVVGARVVQAAYPQNKRTWLRFSDDGYTGANLFALNTPAAAKALAAWSAVERDRKKAWALIRHFGLGLALRAFTRTISLSAAIDRAARRLGFTARAVPLPFAEAAIDVDKLSDHVQAETILQRRRSNGGGLATGGESD